MDIFLGTLGDNVEELGVGVVSHHVSFGPMVHNLFLGWGKRQLWVCMRFEHIRRQLIYKGGGQVQAHEDNMCIPTQRAGLLLHRPLGHLNLQKRGG